MASSLLRKVPGQNGQKALWVWFFVCLFVCSFFNLRASGGRIHFDETLKQVLAFGVVSDRI